MRYSTDLTDKQWSIVREIIGKENRGKHFVRHSKRKLINAVMYLNKTGCQWALLPKDFPPYKTVSSFYHRAKQSGLWEKIMGIANDIEKREPIHPRKYQNHASVDEANF